MRKIRTSIMIEEDLLNKIDKIIIERMHNVEHTRDLKKINRSRVISEILKECLKKYI